MIIQKNRSLYEALTPEDKMDMWYDGTRGLNISACGDAKLKMYYDICIKKGYTLKAAQLSAEAQSRGLPWAGGSANKASLGPKPVVTQLSGIPFSTKQADIIANYTKTLPEDDLIELADCDILTVLYFIIWAIVLKKQDIADFLKDKLTDGIFTLDELKIEITNILNRPDTNKIITKYLDDNALKEDTKKKATGKWVNKGKAGEHGEFRTKKAADAQRKAMFANGFKEDLTEWMSREAMINSLKELGYENYKFDRHSDGELWNMLQWAQAKRAKQAKPAEIAQPAKPVKKCKICNTALTDFGQCPVCDLGDKTALEDSLDAKNLVFENIEKHEELNPKLWNEDNTIKQEVSDKINQIVEEFVDNLLEDNIDITVKDIILIGSNCSYNYTDDSDLDIHIITDTKDLDDDLLPKLYSAYRSLFNKKLDINFYDIPVEIYVETESTKTVSNGIYSVMNNSWIKEPVKEDIPEIDKESFDKEFKIWEDRYNKIINNCQKEIY